MRLENRLGTRFHGVKFRSSLSNPLKGFSPNSQASITFFLSLSKISTPIATGVSSQTA
jgi:hypothetical protein